jgi:hypothetical protein
MLVYKNSVQTLILNPGYILSIVGSATCTASIDRFVERKFTDNTPVTDNQSIIFGEYIVDQEFQISVTDGSLDYQIKPVSATLIDAVTIGQSTYLITAVDYTIIADDDFVEVTAHGVTITLPTAVDRQSKNYTIINSSDGEITLAADGSQTIQDELHQLIPSESSITVISNGSNWRII